MQITISRTLRSTLKIRGECAPGKTHFGFHKTQLAIGLSDTQEKPRKQMGCLPLTATWPPASSDGGVQPGGAGPSPGRVPGPRNMGGDRVLADRPWAHLASTTVCTKHYLSGPCHAAQDGTSLQGLSYMGPFMDGSLWVGRLWGLGVRPHFWL